MEDNDNPFSGVNWKNFEKYFGGNVPFPPKDRNDSATWVEEYVQNLLKQIVPASNPESAAGHYDTEIVETHQTIIVKVMIPDIARAKNMRVGVSSNQLKLEGASAPNLQLIRLPHPVIPTSCKAVFKAGILQIHIRKQNEDEHFYEIDVKYV